MEELSLSQIINFIGSKVILMTLLPSLFLNVIIDSIQESNIVNPNSKISTLTITNGLLSVLGLFFGLIYYFVLNTPIDECILHSLAIVGLSYLFCRIDIYDLVKNKINNKLENKNNE